MGNRDKPKGNLKKPKKKDPREVKPLATATLAAPTPMPELVRRKKRQGLAEAES